MAVEVRLHPLGGAGADLRAVAQIAGSRDADRRSAAVELPPPLQTPRGLFPHAFGGREVDVGDGFSGLDAEFFHPALNPLLAAVAAGQLPLDPGQSARPSGVFRRRAPLHHLREARNVLDDDDLAVGDAFGERNQHRIDLIVVRGGLQAPFCRVRHRLVGSVRLADGHFHGPTAHDNAGSVIRRPSDHRNVVEQRDIGDSPLAQPPRTLVPRLAAVRRGPVDRKREARRLHGAVLHPCRDVASDGSVVGVRLVAQAVVIDRQFQRPVARIAQDEAAIVVEEGVDVGILAQNPVEGPLVDDLDEAAEVVRLAVEHGRVAAKDRKPLSGRGILAELHFGDRVDCPAFDIHGQTLFAR